MSIYDNIYLLDPSLKATGTYYPAGGVSTALTTASPDSRTSVTAVQLGEELERLARLHAEWLIRQDSQGRLLNPIPNAVSAADIPFDEAGVIVLPALGAGWSTVVRVIVPQGYDGYINRFSANLPGVGLDPGSGDVAFRLSIDGRPVRNFSLILTEKGSVENPRDIEKLQLLSGQTIEGQVNHIANPALAGKAIMSLNGMFVPIRLISEY